MGYIPWSLRVVFWISAQIMEVRTARPDVLGELTDESYMELKGISNVTNIPVHEVMAVNFVYELFAH